jgi:peptide-methionine (S)-S-oxide reductase
MKLSVTIKCVFSLLASIILFSSCAGQANKTENVLSNTMKNNELEIATLGAGCFWCVEAVFQQLEGVEEVVSGYMGGQIKNPSYKEVCTGRTGHAEVIQLKFNSQVISFEEILSVFFQTHDPTTKNRQGNDVGTQYRSAIFYHSVTQKELAEETIEKLNTQNVFEKPVVTEVAEASVFYKAEDYHQDYYNNNNDQPYCSWVIKPKLEKLEKVFGDKLKK